jgi:hypothetical protein
MHDSRNVIRPIISALPCRSAAAVPTGNGAMQVASVLRIAHLRYRTAPETVVAAIETVRCRAAHAEDVRQCEGQRDAVQIVDRTGAGVAGCVLHAAVLLASLVDGRVIPLNGPDSSAIDVFRRAQTMPAFDFRCGHGVARADAAFGQSPSDAGPFDEDQGRLCWSRSGNARSSCLIETTESGPRGSA